jgi:hypothetical protein
MKRFFHGVAAGVMGLALAGTAEAHEARGYHCEPRPHACGEWARFWNYYYPEREHRHWARSWDPVHRRYHYWDAYRSCYFYWYAPRSCYYPDSYCP